jgi:hypothetical protein
VLLLLFLLLASRAADFVFSPHPCSLANPCSK